MLERITEESGISINSIDREALDELRERQWPGNVRELRNVLFRAAAMCSDKTIRLADLSTDVGSPKNPTTGDQITDPHGRSLRDAKLRHVVAVYEQCGGNKSAAARKLGISRVTLRARLKESGID